MHLRALLVHLWLALQQFFILQHCTAASVRKLTRALAVLLLTCAIVLQHTTTVLQIKQNLGLDQAKACFTAAAPIAIEVLQYFASLDLPIYEVSYSVIARLLTSVIENFSHQYLQQWHGECVP
jgi:hypothetical protein